jgi:hypothetical protein
MNFLKAVAGYMKEDQSGNNAAGKIKIYKIVERQTEFRIAQKQCTKEGFLKWLFNFLVLNNSGHLYIKPTLCPFSLRLWIQKVKF